MQIKYNKKASWISLETLAVIVFSAICIFLIILAGVKISGIFINSSEQNKAYEVFDSINEAVIAVYDSNTNNELTIYPPKKWYLKSYEKSFPKNECNGKKGCLCICDDGTCNLIRKCNGFDFYVVVEDGYTSYNQIGGDMPDLGIEYKNTLEFFNSFYILDITKVGDVIIINSRKKT
ncbi:MAG: hypothetical protein WC867_06855 [Candidatus Pacearchaeota archaeon]